MKTAIIVGISGQDGAYLSKFLLGKGYRVVGTSRDAARRDFSTLERLGVKDKVELVSMALTDFHNVLTVLEKYEPEEVYNLAGQSSVSLSFEQPIQTVESITVGTLQLLEAIRTVNRDIRFYNASSGEMFGDSDEPCSEDTPLAPRSPYGVAKVGAHLHTRNYREAYGLYTCSGILFNHESPLRPEHFVTKKIVTKACRIANGGGDKLRLGNLAVSRDWGWAPEYIEVMWLMLQGTHPQDFVIATGEGHRLQEFVETTFSNLGLDYRDHVLTNESLFRPCEIAKGVGDPALAKSVLGWEAAYKMKDVIRLMVEAEGNTSTWWKENSETRLSV